MVSSESFLDRGTSILDLAVFFLPINRRAETYDPNAQASESRFVASTIPQFPIAAVDGRSLFSFTRPALFFTIAMKSFRQSQTAEAEVEGCLEPFTGTLVTSSQSSSSEPSCEKNIKGNNNNQN